jgi:hypothetical protein
MVGMEAPITERPPKRPTIGRQPSAGCRGSTSPAKSLVSCRLSRRGASGRSFSLLVSQRLIEFSDRLDRNEDRLRPLDEELWPPTLELEGRPAAVSEAAVFFLAHTGDDGRRPARPVTGGLPAAAATCSAWPLVARSGHRTPKMVSIPRTREQT